MCGRLVNLDTVARVLADYYYLKTETQLAALDEALSRVPAVSAGGGHGKDHVADPNNMVGDLISRAEALEAMDTWDKFGCNPDGKLVRYDDDSHYVPYVHYDDMVHAIKALPSAQKKGHWIDEKTSYSCSECHRGCWVNSDYCPWCGADMRGESDG